MEILFLTTVLPHARSTGGEIASQALIDAMRETGHRVTVVGYRRAGDRDAAPPDVVEIGRRPIETDTAPRTHVAAWWLSAALRRLPYSAAKYRSRAYSRRVRELLRSRPPGVVVVDHAQMGWLLNELDGRPLAVVAHNLEHLLYTERTEAERGARRRAYAREQRLTRAVEERLAARAAEIWALTGADAAAFAKLGPARTRTLELSSAFALGAPAVKKNVDVALIGSWTWDVTRRALSWFLERVQPLLGPDLSVEVAGRGADWLAAAAPAVRYRGFVPDAREFLASARVVAVPGTSGTGVQVKTLDAIASGAQVVATPDALRGIEDPPPSVHVAATPEEFAAAIRELAAAPESLEPSRQALDWTRRRRERLAADVDAALGAVAG